MSHFEKRDERLRKLFSSGNVLIYDHTASVNEIIVAKMPEKRMQQTKELRTQVCTRDRR